MKAAACQGGRAKDGHKNQSRTSCLYIHLRVDGCFLPRSPPQTPPTPHPTPVSQKVLQIIPIPAGAFGPRDTSLVYHPAAAFVLLLCIVGGRKRWKIAFPGSTRS